MAITLVPNKINYNDQVIEQLEILLERAKEGDIVELVAVSKYKDNTYDYTWTGTTNLQELAGVIGRILHSIYIRMDG